MPAKVFDNQDGEWHCHECGHKPQVLMQLNVTTIICQHCLADAAAMLAFEVGREVCGNCRAFHKPIVGEGWCLRRPPQVMQDGLQRRPAVNSSTPACEERLPRDRFRAGAAPEIGGAR